MHAHLSFPFLQCIQPSRPLANSSTSPSTATPFIFSTRGISKTTPPFFPPSTFIHRPILCSLPTATTTQTPSFPLSPRSKREISLITPRTGDVGGTSSVFSPLGFVSPFCSSDRAWGLGMIPEEPSVPTASILFLSSLTLHALTSPSQLPVRITSEYGIVV